MGISMGKWPDFEYHGGKWLKYDRSGLTHLTHPWGPPWWFDALNSLPVVIFGHFRHAWKWPKFLRRKISVTSIWQITFNLLTFGHSFNAWKMAIWSLEYFALPLFWSSHVHMLSPTRESPLSYPANPLCLMLQIICLKKGWDAVEFPAWPHSEKD